MCDKYLDGKKTLNSNQFITNQGCCRLPQEDGVLENETRKMIYNHVAAYPGVSYSTLRTVFNLPDGTLRYHLNYLIKNDMIKLAVEKAKRIYFPNHDPKSNSNPQSHAPAHLNLTSSQERLLTTIKLYPGISQKELTNVTKIKKFTVSNNLRRLMDLNLIRKINDENKVGYELISDEILKYEVLKGLVLKLLKKEIDEETFLRLKRKIE
jgi:predicted transcriptional regulator